MKKSATFASRANRIISKYPNANRSDRDKAQMNAELEALAVEQEDYKKSQGVPQSNMMAFGGYGVNPNDPVDPLDVDRTPSPVQEIPYVQGVADTILSLPNYEGLIDSPYAKYFTSTVKDKTYKYGAKGTGNYTDGKQTTEDEIDCSGAVCVVKNALEGTNLVLNNTNASKLNHRAARSGLDIGDTTDGDMITMRTKGGGIDHVGFIVVDSEGRRYIAESSSSYNGTTITPYQERMDDLRSRNPNLSFELLSDKTASDAKPLPINTEYAHTSNTKASVVRPPITQLDPTVEAEKVGEVPANSVKVTETIDQVVDTGRESNSTVQADPTVQDTTYNVKGTEVSKEEFETVNEFPAYQPTDPVAIVGSDNVDQGVKGPTPEEGLYKKKGLYQVTPKEEAYKNKVENVLKEYAKTGKLSYNAKDLGIEVNKNTLTPGIQDLVYGISKNDNIDPSVRRDINGMVEDYWKMAETRKSKSTNFPKGTFKDLESFKKSEYYYPEEEVVASGPRIKHFEKLAGIEQTQQEAETIANENSTLGDIPKMSTSEPQGLKKMGTRSLKATVAGLPDGQMKDDLLSMDEQSAKNYLKTKGIALEDNGTIVTGKVEAPKKKVGDVKVIGEGESGKSGEPTEQKSVLSKYMEDNAWLAPQIASGMASYIGNERNRRNVKDASRIQPDTYKPSVNSTWFDSSPMEVALRNQGTTAIQGMAERGTDFDSYLKGISQINNQTAASIGGINVEGQRLNMAEQSRIDAVISDANKYNSAMNTQADIRRNDEQLDIDQLRRDYASGSAESVAGMYSDMSDKMMADKMGEYYDWLAETQTQTKTK